ncbi:MAG: glycosyltransferase [Microthrixaceae bacterium]
MIRVVVLNWNAADLTSRCVRSIDATDWPADDLDLVIVDNGSIDGSAQLLGRRHPTWRLVRNPTNLGFAEGINRALRDLVRPDAPDVDLVALVNNDAVVQPGWLAPLVGTLVDHPEAGAASPLILFDRWFVEVLVAVGGGGARARLLDATVNGLDVRDRLICGEGVARPPHPSIPLRLEIEVAERASLAVPVPDPSSTTTGSPLPEIALTFESARPIAVVCGEAQADVAAGEATAILRPAVAPHRLINSCGTALTEWCEGFERLLGRPIEPLPPAETVPGFTGGGVLLRVAALADVGLFDPKFFMYYEDTDLAWRMRRAGWTTVSAPDAVLHHRLGATAGSTWPGFFHLNYRNWLLTVVRNGGASELRRARAAAWGNSWPFVRRNVVGRVRRLQRPELAIAARWLGVWGGVKASLPRVLATRARGRWRRVGMSPTDRVAGPLVRRSAPSPPKPEPDGPAVVYVDVGDTLRSRWRAGIQRAVSELVTRLLLDHPEVSVVLMAWSPLDEAFRRLDGDETEAFFSPEAMPNHTPPPPPTNPPAWRRLVTGVAAIGLVRAAIDGRRRATAVRRRPASHRDLVIHAIPAGAVVLDLDATWNNDDAPRSSLYPAWRRSDVRVISLLHDVLPVTHPDWFDPNLVRVFAAHVAAAIADADMIVTSSRFSAAELRTLAQGQGRATDAAEEDPLALEVMALGADPVARAPQHVDRKLLDALADRRTVLVVGTLEPRKNHGGLLDAFDRLTCDATLVIVGRQGWKADDLATRILEHPSFGDRVLWPSSVNDATLDELYGAASVVAVPSFAEGYGLPVVEALRHGCRVVSSEGGSLPEVGGHGVTYVDATDPTAFAAALDAALANPAPATLEATELPTWDHSAAALAELIVGVAKKRTTGAGTA